MLDIIISIALSLNIHFTIVDHNTMAINQDEVTNLTNSVEFIERVNDGSIHDIKILFDERSNNNIIVTPEVDPIEDN